LIGTAQRGAVSVYVQPIGGLQLAITMNREETRFTTAPVQAGDSNGVLPEFGRCADLLRIFGIRKGSAYNLLADGKIRGVLLRVRGRKSGVRLFDLASVREYIRSQMENENNGNTATSDD